METETPITEAIAPPGHEAALTRWFYAEKDVQRLLTRKKNGEYVSPATLQAAIRTAQTAERACKRRGVEA